MTIDHIEVTRKNLDKVKKAFRIKDNAEAIRKALGVAAGKIELEGVMRDKSQ